MKDQMHYVAAHYWLPAEDGKLPELGLEGFIRAGTLDEAKAYLKVKQQGSRDKVKLFKLVEVEV